MKKILILSLLIVQIGIAQEGSPNIILIMADDLGYGDVGFTENNIPMGDYDFDGTPEAWDTPILTPELDDLAGESLELSNFYSVGPVCSPTRGAFLTGRHYGRFGIFAANQGALPAEEITLATMCKSKGYATGHFGKWHIGTLDENRSPKPHRRGRPEYLAEPWERGYDYFFGTETSISTWDPQPGTYNGGDSGNPYVVYDVNDETTPKIVTESLSGDDSEVMIDKVIPFIENAQAENKPFLAVVWFHAPHEPFKAGPDDKALYSSYTDEEQDYYGCVTAMSRQVGRLNDFLEANNLDENTIILFTSDNGPEGKLKDNNTPDDISDDYYTKPGRAGNLRGRKRSTYNGGVLVPSFIKWPGKTDHEDMPAESTYQSSVLDLFPTIAEEIGYEMPDTRPMDGRSLIPFLDGNITQRENAIPFLDSKKMAWIENDIKFKINKSGLPVEAYNMITDRAESTNLINTYSDEDIDAIQADCIEWNCSVNWSYWGYDYLPDPFTPSEVQVLENNQTDSDGDNDLSESELEIAIDDTWEGLNNITCAEVPESPLSVIEHEEQDLRFNIYPNPATDKIQINGQLEGYKIRVVDIKGIVLGTYSSNQNELSIDFSSFPSGAYIVTLENKFNADLDFRKIVIKQ
ncbi:MAG: sulfatase-like hydrolase/transferase [Urechidicola sp.]|nr:sulfatase-like hydrolase/transferase [Urechidicola sp.]